MPLCLLVTASWCVLNNSLGVAVYRDGEGEREDPGRTAATFPATKTFPWKVELILVKHKQLAQAQGGKRGCLEDGMYPPSR